MAFGIEIYAPNGNTILSMSSRVPRFVQQGIFTLASGANTTTNVSNMANNDSWDVVLVGSGFGFGVETGGLTYTLNTGFFRTFNSLSSSQNVTYWVVRS